MWVPFRCPHSRPAQLRPHRNCRNTEVDSGLHKHRELRREANDTKSTAQRAIARNQRHEGQRYETDGSKADGTKPTASYTRVVARAITCDWVVM